MDSCGVTCESKMILPVLFIPNRYVTLLTPYDILDNIRLNTKITIIDFDGRESRLFSGACNIRFIDDNAQIPQLVSDSDTKEVVTFSPKLDLSPPKDPEVWIDPHRNPYLNSNYGTNESQSKYSVDQEDKHKHFKNCKRQIVDKCSESFDEMEHKQKKSKSYNEFNDPNYSPAQDNLNENNAFESDMFLSLPAVEINGKESKDAVIFSCIEKAENSALRQFMPPDTQLSNEQQKTIPFLDNDNEDKKIIPKIEVNEHLAESIPEAAADSEAATVTVENTVKAEYECDKCKQTFDEQATFKQHMVNHMTIEVICRSERDNQYMCLQCGKRMKTREKFEKHCFGHGDPELECDKCFKVFASKFTLRTHRKVHMRKYPCKNCTMTFSKVTDLKAHAANTHSVYNCGTPQYTASDEGHLEVHRSDHEGSATEVKEMELVPEITIDDKVPGQSATPPHTKELMTSEENEWEDANKTEADAVIYKIITNKNFLLNSKAARKQKKFSKTCNICSKSFDRIGDLKRHLIEHLVTVTLSKNPVDKDGSLAIQCQICRAKVFNKTDKYKEHLREHAKLTLYRCTYCNKSFGDSSNYSKHKKVHGSGFLQCDYCQRKFNSKRMIILHMDYHNKNSPLHCSDCNRKFYFKSMLRKHIKYAHATQTSKRYRCRFCHGYYKTLKEKWDHEWTTHAVRKTIADCSICESKFRKYSELKRHCSIMHDVHIPFAKKFYKNIE